MIVSYDMILGPIDISRGQQHICLKTKLKNSYSKFETTTRKTPHMEERRVERRKDKLRKKELMH